MNDSSPYEDNRCTATRLLALEAEPIRPAGRVHLRGLGAAAMLLVVAVAVVGGAVRRRRVAG